MSAVGIPGLRRFDHVGLTVPDIDAATRFLVDVVGCEFLYSLGSIDRGDNWMFQHLRVGPGTSVKEVRFFRCGRSPVFEVFEYQAPRQGVKPPLNSDIGGHHIALYVDDLDAAVRYLQSSGVEVLGKPTDSAGAHKGQRWVYFLAPWGAQFELVSYPRGRAWYLEHEVHESTRDVNQNAGHVSGTSKEASMSSNERTTS